MIKEQTVAEAEPRTPLDAIEVVRKEIATLRGKLDTLTSIIDLLPPVRGKFQAEYDLLHEWHVEYARRLEGALSDLGRKCDYYFTTHPLPAWKPEIEVLMHADPAELTE